MPTLIKKLKKFDPPLILAVGFASLALLGALLLMFPISSAGGVYTPFLTCLFTATSAVCVTGLTVVETGTYWSAFGKFIIIALIQIGGLGFMSLATVFLVLAGRKISLRNHMILGSSLNTEGISGLVHFVKYVVVFTVGVELVGAVLLSFAFVPVYGFRLGVVYSLFHSISAFCNAGFDVLGTGTSLAPFATNVWINLIICALIIIGGLGFAVVMDIFSKKRFSYFEVHTKLVLCISGVLLSVGTLLFFFWEYNNPGTMASVPLFGKFLESFFLSVTTRTAGFANLNMSALTGASKFLAILFMFIGGSPGSTAGGVKTTTFSMLFFVMFSTLKGCDEATVFSRTIKESTIRKSITVILLAFLWCVACVFVLSTTEPVIEISDLIFETVSAVGTVGLSTGITSLLSPVGRILMILSMFVGRVGITTVVYALFRKGTAQIQTYKFPDADISIG